jgi:hypothetical protein
VKHLKKRRRRRRRSEKYVFLKIPLLFVYFSKKKWNKKERQGE